MLWVNGAIRAVRVNWVTTEFSLSFFLEFEVSSLGLVSGMTLRASVLVAEGVLDLTRPSTLAGGP
jgi:hypothetical protein